MRSYRIEISERARRDADAIFDYLAERAPEGASAWATAFFQALDQLRSDPERHRHAEESEVLDIDLRELLFKTRKGRPYRLLFIVRDQSVLVAAIRGSGQDLATSEEIDLSG